MEAKVRLMKLKMKAEGSASIPQVKDLSDITLPCELSACLVPAEHRIPDYVYLES